MELKFFLHTEWNRNREFLAEMNTTDTIDLIICSRKME